MKKSMYLVAATAVALASCSTDELVQQKDGSEINFSVVADNDSRAATVYCNNNLMRGFNLYAGYNNGSWSTFIEEDYVTVLENGKCTQTETRYWPETGNLTFFGLVNTPANDFTTMIPASNATSEVVWGAEVPVVKDFTPDTDVTKQTDLLYAVAAGCTKAAAPVQMNFRHALSQIEFRAKNQNPQLHVVIDAVRVGQTDAQGTYSLPSESTVPNYETHDQSTQVDDYVKGTWSDVKGTEDYLVQFNSVAVPYDEGKVQNLTISNDGAETNNNSLLLIPTMEDGVATTPWTPANAATYDGTYLAIYCTIYNVAGDSYVEGSDVAVLHKGWAVIPVSFKWKQGKKYIYTFNFSKEGNGGYEGGENIDDKTPTDIPVLTGIELEVTVDDFLYGDNYINDMDTEATETVALNNENIVVQIANGGSFILDEDITLDATLNITKDVVLDLNGKTIKNNAGNTTTDVIVVAAGAKLTLNGEGTVEAVTGNDGYAVIADGELIINDGTFKSGIDQNGEPNAVIYARGNGKVYVNGGYFPNDNTSKFVLNKKDADRATTVIEVKGGTFDNFNPANNAAENAGTNFVAEGYVSVGNGSGTWTVKAAEDFFAGNVTLAEDLILTTAVSLENVTLDLNGKTITLNAPADGSVNDVKCYGTTVIKGGEIVAANAETSRRCIYNYGDMTIDGTKFVQAYARKGAAINNEGKMTIKDATVDAVYYSIWNSGANADLTIEGGSFKTANDETIRDTWAYCVNNSNGARLVINGGNFTGNHGVINSISGAKAILNGGTFHCTATYTGNSDWTLYTDTTGSISYNEANCTITSDNTNGAIYSNSNVVPF